MTNPAAYLLQGDARQIPLADGSVQCVVTSPPYWGLRDYGHADQLGLEPTPEGYVAHLVAVFREVRRVLRTDGTCWVNLGDSYVSTPSGSKGDTTGFRNGTAYQANFGGIKCAGLKPKDLVGIPWRVAFALQADGWWLRSDIIWSKPNPMPESITDRPTKAHEYLFLLTKSARYFYDSDAIKEPAIHAGRFVQTNGNDAMDDGYDGHRTRDGFRRGVTVGADRNRRSVWTIAAEPYPDAHFATFPEKLVEPCILAGSRLGDRVFDPFAGSGTTVAVAERLGRVGIGLELKPAYLMLARRRTVQMGLL